MRPVLLAALAALAAAPAVRAQAPDTLAAMQVVAVGTADTLAATVVPLLHTLAAQVAAPPLGVPDTVAAETALPRSLVLRAEAPLASEGAAAPVFTAAAVPDGPLVVGALLGGLAGVLVGGGAGALAGRFSKNDDVYVSDELAGGVLGGIAGMTLGIPIGVHAANRGHGSLSAGLLTSVLTLVGGGVVVGMGAWPVLPLIPVAQVAASITVLRRTW